MLEVRVDSDFLIQSCFMGDDGRRLSMIQKTQTHGLLFATIVLVFSAGGKPWGDIQKSTLSFT
jgi:hypothetical protein